MWEAGRRKGRGRGRLVGCVAVANQLTQTRVRTDQKPKHQPVYKNLKNSDKHTVNRWTNCWKLLFLVFVLPKLWNESVGQTIYKTTLRDTETTQMKGEMSTNGPTPVLKGLLYWFSWLRSYQLASKLL